MNHLFAPLTESELKELEDFLLDRIGDDVDVSGKDEGIFDISSLDGFFTAIVSGPVMIAPSQWMATLWGDFEPEWETEEAFEDVFRVLMRYMNSIADHLINEPESFEPLFMQRVIEGNTYLIVDDWCYGYMMAVDICVDQWRLDSVDMNLMLMPLRLFGTQEGWEKLDSLNEQETENLRTIIPQNVREIHAYWLARRELDVPCLTPVQRTKPRTGRNDLCPCGSGKKYKKCCLH